MRCLVFKILPYMRIVFWSSDVFEEYIGSCCTLFTTYRQNKYSLVATKGVVLDHRNGYRD